MDVQSAVAGPAGAQGSANKLPMIHVSDLARVVAAAYESLPEVPYVVAADTRSALEEVVEAISTGLGTGRRPLPGGDQDLMLEDASASNLNVNSSLM